MDGSNNSKAEGAPKEAASAPVDPKQVLNNPHMLAGAQALHKAYNKYNIKATQPSSGVAHVDHSKDGSENKKTGEDDGSKV